MRMPGFTAGASLYKTSKYYKLTAGQANAIGEKTVIPQLMRVQVACIPDEVKSGVEHCLVCYMSGLYIRHCRVETIYHI